MAGGKMRCSCYCYGEGGIHRMDAPILSLPRLKVLAWKGYVVIWLDCWSYDEVFVHQQICEEWSVRLYLMSSRVSTIGLPVDTLRPCCHSRRPSKTIPEEGGHMTLSGKIWASKILVWEVHCISGLFSNIQHFNQPFNILWDSLSWALEIHMHLDCYLKV